MLTGEFRSNIDGVWNAFWTGGIANPLEVIKQITYLLFMPGLDEAQIRGDNEASRLKRPIERRIFPEERDSRQECDAQTVLPATSKPFIRLRSRIYRPEMNEGWWSFTSVFAVGS